MKRDSLKPELTFDEKLKALQKEMKNYQKEEENSNDIKVAQEPQVEPECIGKATKMYKSSTKKISTQSIPSLEEAIAIIQREKRAIEAEISEVKRRIILLRKDSHRSLKNESGENVRRIKVQYKSRECKYVPWVTMSGVWLEKLGFEIGSQLEIRMDENRLIIEKID